MVPLNTDKGYTENVLTGESIEPFVNFYGDTVQSGVELRLNDRAISNYQLEKPKRVMLRNEHNLTRKKAYPNRYVVPKDIRTMPLDEDSLEKVPFQLSPTKDTSHYVLNSRADTIYTGTPVTATGKAIELDFPVSIPAKELRFKYNAINNMQYLDVDQGLTSSYILDILEDQNGNLWIGTSGGGLVRYDGNTLLAFTKKEGLPSNTVRALHEDSDGSIWFTIGSRGLCKYDGKQFLQFSEEEGLIHNSASALLEDQSGNLWIGTYGERIATYNGSTFIYYTEKEGLADDHVRSISQDRQGNMWFSTSGGGITRFNGTHFTHYTEGAGLTNDVVKSVTEDK